MEYKYKHENMEKSNLKSIQAQREQEFAHVKARFKQKWFKDKPCFSWNELNLTEELKATITTPHPSFWLLRLDETNFEDKCWTPQDVRSILFFDWLEDVLPTIPAAIKDEWLKDNITAALEMIDLEESDLVLCYNEGSEDYSKEWKSALEKQLIR